MLTPTQAYTPKEMQYLLRYLYFIFRAMAEVHQKVEALDQCRAQLNRYSLLYVVEVTICISTLVPFTLVSTIKTGVKE